MIAAWLRQGHCDVLSLGFHVNALCRNRFKLIGCICLWKGFFGNFYLYQNNQYNPNLSMYWWALCASHRDAVSAVLGSAVGNAFVNLVCPVQQWLADSDAVIPAQTSGVSAAQGVGLLACRWTPSEEGNAILQGMVVPAIGLKKGDVLVARTC